MRAPSLRRTHLWFALAGVLGLVGCEKTTTSNSPGTKDDAAALSGATGGGTIGTGGGTPGTGGTTSVSGGGAGTGGNASGWGGTTFASGGGTTGPGGSIAGAGGSTTSTGGGKGDAGASKDSGSETQRDAALEAGPAPGDAPGADAGPIPNSGDGGILVPDGYKLVWSDEFDIDGTPDPKNWSYEKGFVRNNELQWYQSKNAAVKGGILTIEGRKEQVTNPNYSASGSDWKTTRQYAQYTSTSMTTSGLQSWQYGRFEMRARIPTAAGMWPAWWTLGTIGEWPSNGEIDIMEFYKGNVLANVACGTATRWSAKWDSSAKAISSLGTNWSSNFHIWRMDWDDQNINLYLDDNLMNGVALSNMLNSDGTSPFKQKVYMILNLAIGGDNGGDPSGTTFPVQYEVDYVRVFQRL